MSLSTIVAARTYLGQQNGHTGEESRLSFEDFPYVGLSKVRHIKLFIFFIEIVEYIYDQFKINLMRMTIFRKYVYKIQLFVFAIYGESYSPLNI